MTWFILIFISRACSQIFLFNYFGNLIIFKYSRIKFRISIKHFFFFLCILFVSSITHGIQNFINLTLFFLFLIIFLIFGFFFSFNNFVFIKTNILIKTILNKQLLKSHSMIWRENQNFIWNAIKISKIFIHNFNSFRSSSPSTVVRVKSIIAMGIIPLNALLLMHSFPKNVFLHKKGIVVWN